MKIIDQSTVAQIDAQKVKVEQFRAIYALKKKQVDELQVRAGYTGILQQLGASAAGWGQHQRAAARSGPEKSPRAPSWPRSLSLRS